jgi:hypothetical protein
VLTSLSKSGSTAANGELFAGVLGKPVGTAELDANTARELGDSALGAVALGAVLSAKGLGITAQATRGVRRRPALLGN